MPAGEIRQVFSISKKEKTMNYISVDEIKKMPRKIRRPKHTFNLRYRPFTIQPFMIAPVLAGETLKHGMIQARTYTDPLKNSAIGWWHEHFVFYVKLRDLYDRDKLVGMLMNPTEDMSSLDSATNVDLYHENTSSGTDINYTLLCLNRVVDEFFRNQGETAASSGTTITGSGGATMPIAGFMDRSYIDSAIDDSDYVTAADDELLDISAGTTIEGGDDKLMVSEVVNAQLRWQLESDAGLTQLTFEEYMAQYSGQTGQVEELNRPELIRYSRDWSYPTNTVDPATGTPRPAMSWVSEIPITKPRRFDEHGFIFGVTVTRPKVYFSGLSSSAVTLMKSQRAWLPPSLMMDRHASMVKVAAGDAPLTNNTEAYWIDVKDILLYGDQFVNFALTATDGHLMDNPTAAMGNIGKFYPSSANIDELFAAASPANRVIQDGVTTLRIASKFGWDSSPNAVGVDKNV